MRFRTRYLDRPTTETARSGLQDRANPETSGSAPADSPRASLSRLWSDGLGRAGTRGAQILLVGAVVVALVWLLSRVSIVTIPLVLALIFAAAFVPWMEWTRRHRIPPALGAALALVFLLAAIIGALVFVVGSVGQELVRARDQGPGRLPAPCGLVADAAVLTGPASAE